MKSSFDHEKLIAYQQSITFVGWADELLATVTAKAAVKDQLDRASTYGAEGGGE